MNPQTEAAAKEMQTAAAAIGRQVIILYANNERDIDSAFAAIMQRRAGALLVGNHIFFNSRDQIVDLAARNKLPAIYEFREFVEAEDPGAGGRLAFPSGIRRQRAAAKRRAKNSPPWRNPSWSMP